MTKFQKAKLYVKDALRWLRVKTRNVRYRIKNAARAAWLALLTPPKMNFLGTGGGMFTLWKLGAVVGLIVAAVIFHYTDRALHAKAKVDKARIEWKTEEENEYGKMVRDLREKVDEYERQLAEDQLAADIRNRELAAANAALEQALEVEREDPVCWPDAITKELRR